MGNSPPQNPVTPLRGYALPVGTNYLSDDVLRLGSALSAIDTDVAASTPKLLSIRSVTTNYSVAVSDGTWLIDYNGSSAADVLTLPALNAVTRGYNVKLRNSTTLQINVAAQGGAVIAGQSLYPLLAGSTVNLVSDGTTWKVLSVAQAAAGVLTAAGSLSLPSHSFSPDPSVGFFLPATGQGALVSTGAALLYWSASGVLVGAAAGGFQGAGTLNAVKLLYSGQDLIARNDGTATAPTYSFGSEASLGSYRVSAGQYGIAVGGVLQFVYSAAGLRGATAAAVSGTQLQGSANLTELYLNGVALSTSLVFSPNGLAVAGTPSGVKGIGSLNAQDLFIKGGSLATLLGLNGVQGQTLNLTDLKIAGVSLATSLQFSPSGLVVPGATGGAQGAGTINVAALYINGIVLNPGLLSPSVSNALTYLRVNAAGNGLDYRSPAQVLADLGAQPALGYVPLSRSGDTIASLTVQGTLTVGASTTLNSALTVLGVTSLTNLGVSGSVAVTSNLSVGGSTALASTSATSLTVTGSFGVTGASTLNGLNATSGRFTGTLTALGATTLAVLSAGAASFSGMVTAGNGLVVSGQTALARLSTSSTSTFGGLTSFTAGMSLVGGGMTVGFGQAFMTTDSTNGFQFQSGSIGTQAGNIQVLAQHQSTVGNNHQSLLLTQRRRVSGFDWTTVPTRLQMQTDVTRQGWIEWGAVDSGLGGLRFGAVSAAGADVMMLTLDPQNGATYNTNVSVNGFFGVAGGVQLNGGVSMTGGITVDTLTGSADWYTSGNLLCRYVRQTSDERLKTGFAPITIGEAKRFIERADPFSYAWKKDTGRRHYGYGAHKVQTLGFDNLVHVGPADGLDDALSLDYSGAIPLLHVALRDAMEQIRDLKRRLSVQERRTY